MASVTQTLVAALFGVVEFIVGFMIGSLVDLGFYRLYEKIDPERKSDVKLACMMILQFYVLFVLILSVSNINTQSSTNRYFLKVGMLSSQLFLLKFCTSRVKHVLYTKSKTKHGSSCSKR
jgi:hypothetical protein